MTTAIDTNILVALWDKDDTLNSLARSALDRERELGGLVMAAPVYAELLAAPSRNEAFLDFFCKETSIAVDWHLNEAVWRAAGRAFRPGRRRGLRPVGVSASRQLRCRLRD